MPPAARAGDITSHGTPLASAAPPGGSLDVLIGGQPAWRVGDVHVCPVTTPNPHTGGAVALGSTTVHINSRPAARSGDQIVEAAGPPNVIALGCMTVLIGG